MTVGLKNLDINCFVSFIGWARTGHSLIGSLLDAHKNVIISNELHAFDMFKDIPRENLFEEIINNSYESRLHNRPVSEEYYQFIDGGHQGTYKNRLDVIGDKKGGGTLVKYRKNKKVVERFKNYIQVPLKFILVLRNPIDSISTSLIKRPSDFMSRYKTYINNFETLEMFLNNYSSITHIVRFEDIITDFNPTFTSLLDFLNLSKDEEYINNCSSIIFNNIPQSRNKFEWDEESLSRMRELVSRFDLLSSYRGSF